MSNLNAVELSTLCTSFTQDCKITTPYSIITNHSNFVASGGEAIVISPAIGSFINYGDIRVGSSSLQTFTLKESSSYIEHFINYGTFSSLNLMGFWVSNAKGISNITNYGVMGSINYNATTPLTLNNLGLIGAGEHIKTSGKISIQNYMVRISEAASIFNNFTNDDKPNFSHLKIKTENGGSVAFKDNNSKVILDFDNGFEFGKEYKINKIAVDTNGNPYNNLGVDFSRLTVTSDIYLLSQRGDNFVVDFVPQYGIVGTLYKSNIRTMNNFWTLSNSMIYPRKSYHLQNLGKKNPSLLDSAISLKSYESFSYRNESINRRIQRQNKRNYNRRLPNQSTSSQNLKENQRNLQNLNLDSANQNNQNNPSLRASEYERGNPQDLQALRSNHPQNQNNPQTQTFSQNLTQNPNYSQTPHNYYFILTPFFNHNSFAQSGNYNLNGFDYGFLTAFSTQVAESNSLGAHFIFSYGTLGDSKDKDLSIKSLNLNLGINYKLDLIWDMYLKARGDFYYFSNTLDSLTIKNIKPNNLGFGASVIFGKDFNFGKGGMLGIEAGIDYKALKTNKVSLNSQTYQKSLYNLIYADVGVNYSKYFGGFGINLGTGFKANLAPKLAESTLLLNSQTLKFTLDNDKYLAYANAGISYLLNTKNFDMEFSLAYYGNYGDRVISNGGGVEWKVGW